MLCTLAGKVAQGDVDQYQPVPLGFTPLDKTIGGGLRAGELLLIGGAQGTGKTTMAVQMARNIVMGGQASVLYVCFEHDEEYLLNRIIALESVLPSLPSRAGASSSSTCARRSWAPGWRRTADRRPGGQPAPAPGARAGQPLRPQPVPAARLADHQHGREHERARAALQGAVGRPAPGGLRRLHAEGAGHPEPTTETEKVTIVVNGLKDLALQNDVPIISIVAADKEGLKAARLRNHHLRGSSAINYEADIILILNEKYQIVAKVNIEFNPYQAQRFRDWVMATVEKNRGGQNAVDLEFEKHFEYSCFDPTAGRSRRSSSRSASTTTDGQAGPPTYAHAQTVA